MNGSVHSSDPSASLDMQDSCICLSVSPLTILILRKVATSVTPQICSHMLPKAARPTTFAGRVMARLIGGPKLRKRGISIST